MAAQLNRILTTKGYSILKSSLSAKDTEKIQKELLVAPKVNSKYMGKAALDALVKAQGWDKEKK